MPGIKTFLRIKPSKEASPSFEVTEDEPSVLKVLVPTESATGSKTDAKMQYNFKFDGVFGATATQDEIFDVAAREMCDHFVNGFNCTLFAYGQTGSGKTHTMEGGSARYEDRGLIPRCLAYIYAQLAARNLHPTDLQVNFLEIYNENAYDLLNAASGVNARLPKVTVQDQGHSCVLHNLSVHGAPSEDVATNLLFIGRTNRSVAKTSMNLQSSRSHSVFTLVMRLQQPGAETVVESKLNLVDLAGSERVHKSHAEGRQLTEALHINKSLSFLEAVIIALQKGGPARRHIPYRNSLLTTLLRDSLGGNCLTAMIATVSTTEGNKYESVSTCRFAQRVALVDNDAHRNEIIDDKTLIKRLRRRIAELQAELALTQQVAAERGSSDGAAVAQPFSPGGRGTPMEPLDRPKCEAVVRRFVAGKVTDPLQALPDAGSLRIAFDVLRALILQQRSEIDDLSAAAQAGELTAEKLRTLQAKFGVTRARMRNLETVAIVPSGYGVRPLGRTPPRATAAAASQQQQPQRVLPLTRLSADPSDDAAEAAAEAAARGAAVRERQDEYEAARRQAAAQKKARKLAEQKLVQLVMAEDDTVTMLHELTERVARQHELCDHCDRFAPHKSQAERLALRQLQQEQQLLQSQLGELRTVRARLEEGLGAVRDPVVSVTARGPSAQQPRRAPAAAASVTSLPPPGVVVVPTATMVAPARSRVTPAPTTTSVSTTTAATAAAPPALARSRSSLSSEPRPDPASLTRSRTTLAATASRAEDDALAATQRDLERREESTRQKLAALKLQMQQHAASTQQVPPAAPRLAFAATAVPAPMAPVTHRPAARPMSRSTESSSDDDDDDAGGRRFKGGRAVGAARSPVPAPAAPAQQEQRFMRAMEQQKGRIAQIRRAIQAATVIQRAWRKYRASRGVRRHGGGGGTKSRRL